MSSNPIRETAPFLPLFVPGNRLDRLTRAAGAGADAVIVDLEDAVAEDEKDAARTALESLAGHSLPVPVLVRVNATRSRHFEADMTLVTTLEIEGIVLPKAEVTAELDAIRRRLGTRYAIVALVETARGLAEARALAHAADRLAFGSIDFAGAISAAHGRDALLTARSELVLAAALASAPPPLDGITRRFDAEQPVEDDAAYAASLGFGGKLLIHPAQIVPAIRGFAPDRAEVDRARELLAQADANAGRFEGAMVDLPVLAAARRQVEAYRWAKARLAAIQGA